MGLNAAFDELETELRGRILGSGCEPTEDRGDLRHGDYWPGLYADVHREEKTPEGHSWGVDLLVVERDGRMAVNRWRESWRTDAFDLSNSALPDHRDDDFCTVCADGSCRLCYLSERDGVRPATVGTAYAEPTVFSYEDFDAFDLGMLSVAPGEMTELGSVSWGPNGLGDAPQLVVGGRTWAGIEHWVPALGPDIDRCNGLDDDDDGQTDTVACPARANAIATCNAYKGCTYQCAPGYLDSDGIHETGCEAVVGASPLPICEIEPLPDIDDTGAAEAVVAAGARVTSVTGLVDAVGLSAGSDFACALRRTGDIVCWGRNHGRGKAKTLGAHPGPDAHSPVSLKMNFVYERNDNNIGEWSPQLLSPGPGTSLLAAHKDVTCASNGGSIYCWGDDNRALWPSTAGHIWHFRKDDLPNNPDDTIVAFWPGEMPCLTLASGRKLCRNAPNSFFEWNDVGAIRGEASAITDHPGCWRDTGGIWCWRDGVRTLESSPLVTEDLGTNHRCSIEGGLVTCVGANEEGQLGRTGNELIPVPNVTGAIEVAVGDAFSCALLSSGTVSCWGSDIFGQRGDGP